MVCLKLGSELRNPPKKLKENDEADPKQCITLDGIMKCQNSIKKHTDSKKPGCPSCGQCTFCPAIVECKTPDKHKVRKLGGGRPSKNQKCNLGGKPMLPPWVTPSKDEGCTKDRKAKVKSMSMTKASLKDEDNDDDDLLASDESPPRKRQKVLDTKHAAETVISSTIDVLVARKEAFAELEALNVELTRKKNEIAEMSATLKKGLTVGSIVEALKTRERALNAKEKLQLIAAVLQIENCPAANDIDQFKVVGYSEEELYDKRTKRRVKNVYNGIHYALDKLICPGGSTRNVYDVLQSETPGIVIDEKQLKSLQKLEAQTLDLSICGDRTTNRVADAILAGSFTSNTYLKERVKTRCEELMEDIDRDLDDFTIPLGRKRFGRKKYATARRNNAIIQGGGSIARLGGYKFRPSAEKIESALEYFTTKLQVKPGVTRSVKVDGHQFHWLPEYGRGGDSLQQLFEEYKKAQSEMNLPHLGRPTFTKLAHFISTKGESKTGLSSHYVRLSHAFEIVRLILARLKEMVGTMSVIDAEFNKKLDSLEAERVENKQFLTYGYIKSHLQMESKIASHCSRHALNPDGSCNTDDCTDKHNHLAADPDCEQCVRPVRFFDKLKKAVEEVMSKLEGVANLEGELTSMVKCKPELEEHVLTYMAHRVRAFAQQHWLDELEANLIPNVEVILTLDHKQKTLPMKNREGQQEYFGKAGMPLLGAMLTRRTYRMNPKTHEPEVVVEKIHIDMVIDNYRSQDNKQVLGALECLLEYIYTTFEDVQTIHLLSDNASGFASHDCIPFIHRLNCKYKNEKERPFKVDCWAYTEACMGKDDLDGHFSYINKQFEKYVRNDGFEISTEADMVKALQHRGGLKGAHVMHLDAMELAQAVNGGNSYVYDGTTQFKVRGIGVRETHYIEFTNDENVPVQLQTICGITDKVPVPKQHLEKFVCRPLGILTKSSLQCKGEPRVKLEKTEADPPQAPPQDANQPKEGTCAAAFKDAMDARGIKHGADPNAAPVERFVDCCGFFSHGWAQYKTIANKEMSKETQLKLIELWFHGQKDKSCKITADKARAILVDPVDGLLRNNWLEQLIVTVPKIKTLYQNKTKAEMEKLKSELLASDEMGSDAQLIADLNSCIGKKVAFDLRERGQDIIKFGTVLSVKHKTNGKKKASLKRVIDGNFLVEFDDGRKLRNKDFGDIKYAMKYFEEFEDDDPPDDAAGSTEEADLEAFLQALTNEEAALEEEE